MKYIYSIIGTLFFMSIAIGQEAIEVQLKEYNAGKADIITGITGPIKIGTINDDGIIKIPLDNSYKDKLIASIDSDNAGSSDWKTSLPTVQRSYGNCATGEVNIEGGEQIMIALGTVGMFSIANMEERKVYGKIMFASNQEFAEAFLAFGKFKVKKGYQLDWLYFEKEATVEGSCSLESYTSNMEEKYNYVTEYSLDFKPGWNLVKYEILEVFTDSDGNQYTSHDRSTVIDDIPKDVQICYIK